jgi:threonine/homoserine/homoserine lactone efflux protein
LTTNFWTGFLTNVLNAKPAIFILAFIPQFISNDRKLRREMFILGAGFALMAFAVFAMLDCSATVVVG